MNDLKSDAAGGNKEGVNALPYDLQDFTAVIVTGGSSGIGAAFIEAITSLYHPKVLFNLSRQKPEEKFINAGLRHVECDLSSAEARDAAVEVIVKGLNEHPQGPVLLINNSGFGAYGVFPEPSAERNIKMIEVNVIGLVDLTAQLLPHMEPRGGAVVNISSTASWQPTPYLANYGATKAFVTHWGLSLDIEWRPKGVQVLTICPGPTETNFFKAAGFDEPPASGYPGQTADQVVQESIKALESGKRIVVCGWRNRLMVWVTARLPKSFCAWISGVILKRVRSN